MNTHCAKEAKEAAAVIVVVILKEVVNLTECGSKPYLTHTHKMEPASVFCAI